VFFGFFCFLISFIPVEVKWRQNMTHTISICNLFRFALTVQTEKIILGKNVWITCTKIAQTSYKTLKVHVMYNAKLARDRNTNILTSAVADRMRSFPDKKLFHSSIFFWKEGNVLHWKNNLIFYVISSLTERFLVQSLKFDHLGLSAQSTTQLK